MSTTSKETVILFGDPSDHIIQQCKARLEANGRTVEICNDPGEWPFEETPSQILDLRTWTETTQRTKPS